MAELKMKYGHIKTRLDEYKKKNYSITRYPYMWIWDIDGKLLKFKLSYRIAK